MWSDFVDNMVTATRLTNDVVYANMEAFKASMQRVKDNSNESSKVTVRVARTFDQTSSYNASGSGGGAHHFYSISPDIPSGYTLERIQGYVLNSPVSGRTPLYKFYKPGTYDYESFGYTPGTERYFYSTSPVTPSGYTLQGIEGYVATTSGPDRNPLYHFHSDIVDDDFYSTNPVAPDGYSRTTDEMGFVFGNPGPDRTPLHHAFNGSSHFYGISGQNADTVRSLPGATLIQDTDCTKYVIDGKKACSVIYSVTKDNYTQKEMDVDFQTGKQSVSISVQGSDFDKYLPVADQMLNSMKVS